MITLNTEKGLVRIESWDDVLSRPGFIENLDPSKYSLDAIIGRYVFKYKVKCGFSNCHTPHNRGFIITTKEGAETNIGKDCGSREFGVDFDAMFKKFSRDITSKEFRERLWSFSFRCDDYESGVQNLRSQEFGADWLHKKIWELTTPNKGCSNHVVTAILKMVRNRSSTIVVSREARGDEKRAIELSEENRPDRAPISRGVSYIDERVGELDGFDALYPENSLKELLVVNIGKRLTAFRELDIDQLEYVELKDWADWVSSADRYFEDAVSIVEGARGLIRKENLKQLDQILDDMNESRAFQEWLKAIGR